MRIALLSFLVSAVALAPGIPLAHSQADKSRYVGLRHGADLPAGHKEIAGALVSDPYKDKKQYGLSHVSRGSVNMVWFEILTHHDSAGRPFWEVKDVLFLPVIQKRDYFLLINCQVKGKIDPEVIAIVDSRSVRGFHPVKRAWRANRRTEMFEVLALTGIKCEAYED